jgi:hypothetical protein
MGNAISLAVEIADKQKLHKSSKTIFFMCSVQNECQFDKKSAFHDTVHTKGKKVHFFLGIWIICRGQLYARPSSWYNYLIPDAIDWVNAIL